MQIGNIRTGTANFSNPQAGRVYDVDDVAPTLNTMTGGGQSAVDCGGEFTWRRFG